MPDAPVPQDNSVPQPVDALSPAAPAPVPVAAPAPAVRMPDTQLLKVKKEILLLVGGFYAVFIAWNAFLLLVLPDPDGGGKQLVTAGLVTSLVGAVVALSTTWFSLQRIAAAKASVAMRRRLLIKVGAIFAPMLIISAVVPVLIIREPSLTLDIVDPTQASDFVAPVAVTISAERANDILRKLGMRPVKYQWDSDGDGKINEETVIPRTTVVFDRQGVYVGVVRIILDNGEVRRVARRIVIPQGVFSLVPVQPVVEKPVKFSVSNLVSDPKAIASIEWDFGDGTAKQTVQVPDILHTYYAVGSYPVTAIVRLSNQTQGTYKRTLTIKEPPPLPFPISVVTEPENLVGPSPFGVIFRIVTDEVLKEIQWDFGDGKTDRGADLLRESHSYDTAGIFPVIIRARSESGSLAEINLLVRSTETLPLRDLTFEGSPDVQNGKISGEVPLEISLTPKTSTPLVQFSWEIPKADPNASVTDQTLNAVYREEGTYTVVLMAVGAEGKSMRMPITIEVKPPSAEPTIQLQPEGGEAPLKVTFDASQTFVPPGDTIAGFKWLFGDETQQTREGELGSAQVVHEYKTPGEFQATLTVVLSSGKTYTAKRTIIVRKPSLSACITPSRLSVAAGKGIEFDSGCSTGLPSSVVWDVRSADNPQLVLAQSEDETYVHVFENPGEYDVSLTLRDEFGNQDKASVTITVTEAPVTNESSDQPVLEDTSSSTQ
jgi:PKD repeat protein